MGLTSTPPRIPVIHIGMPKTATKTLQWRLFIAHSEIFCLGQFDGPKFGKDHKKYDYYAILKQNQLNLHRLAENKHHLYVFRMTQHASWLYPPAESETGSDSEFST